jgi:hypothetical protein
VVAALRGPDVWDAAVTELTSLRADELATMDIFAG